MNLSSTTSIFDCYYDRVYIDEMKNATIPLRWFYDVHAISGDEIEGKLWLPHNDNDGLVHTMKREPFDGDRNYWLVTKVHRNE